MKQTIEVKTSQRIETLDITGEVQAALGDIDEGICVVYSPHTTTGIAINEGADPDVARDVERTLAKLFPREGDYRHYEGNSDSHLKSILTGASATMVVEGGRLVLGQWQSVYFCEFDGPRTRRVFVKTIAG